MRKALAWISLICTGLALPSLSAPEAGDKTPNPPGFRADVDTVIVHVSVSDPSDRFVVGLEKEHFKVFEAKIEQTITHFLNHESPVSVGMILDVADR